MASPEEIALQEALSKGSSDLKFVLTRNDVSNELQGSFYRNGVTTIQKFSSFFRSEEDLIGVLKDSFDTDADTSLQSRAGERRRHVRNARQKLRQRWKRVNGQIQFRLATTSTCETPS